MSFLGSITVLAATVWLGWSIEQRFQKRSYPAGWKVAAALLGLAGLALGAWLLNREHLTSPTIRLVGYPFPVGGYEFIDGRWVGGAVRLALFIVLGDVAIAVGLCLLPLRIAQIIFERSTMKNGPAQAIR